MLLKDKRFFSRLCCVCMAAYFILLMFYYIPYYIIEPKNLTEGLVYLFTYAEEIYGWVLACAFSSVAFLYCLDKGIKKSLLPLLLLSLTRAVYTLPYYYLIALDFGFDSVEGLLISLVATVIDVIILFVKTLAACFVVGFISASYKAKSFKRDALLSVRGSLSQDISPAPAFALTDNISVALLSVCAIEFIYKLALEIYDAVSYIIDYSENYRSDEIIYMVFRFIFILFVFLFSHFVCSEIKNALIKEK